MEGKGGFQPCAEGGRGQEGSKGGEKGAEEGGEICGSGIHPPCPTGVDSLCMSAGVRGIYGEGGTRTGHRLHRSRGPPCALSEGRSCET